ncbi:MAG TPA: hypothetical protein PLP29_03915 [Candidatus Ozemobacteraceae bacterium]|nr:hypothetical protein [Candidatus Ozemobacteraceae bacterium]
MSQNDRDKALTGKVVPVAELDAGLRSAMFDLMSEAYVVKRESFLADLAAKDWAILLHDATGALRGFTSLALMRTEIEGRAIRALFSGDTIIRPDFWGSLELPRVWGRFMLRMIEEARDEELYWFLISSGYKTYRFLPVFFKEYFPRHDRPTPPDLQNILDRLGTLRFGQRYQPDRGIIRLAEPTPLRAGIADLQDERLQDPDVAFFVARNPGHAAGEELACLAPLRSDNLKPFIRRALRV